MPTIAYYAQIIADTKQTLLSQAAFVFLPLGLLDVLDQQILIDGLISAGRVD